MHTPWRPEQQSLMRKLNLGESSLMFLVHPTLSEQSLQKTVDAIQTGDRKYLKLKGAYRCAIRFLDPI